MKLFTQTGRGVAFATDLIAFLLLLLTSLSTQAQVPKQYSQTVISGMVTLANVSSNLNTPIFIDASRSQQITFGSLQSVGTAAATNSAWFLAPSYDGIHMDTNHPVVLLTPQTIVQTNVFDWTVTNVTAGALQGYFFYQYTNGAITGGASTNSLSYSVKISSP